MVAAAEAERLRVAQSGIRAAVERDLERSWRNLWSSIPEGKTRPYEVRDAFLRLVPTLVSRYGESAAAAAADWYEAQRDAAGVRGAFTVELVRSPYEDAVEGAVRRAAGALWTSEPARMLESLTPAVGKYILAASRATITRAAQRDPAASGWMRVTRAGSCRFCRLLAQRGAVYMRDSVHFASHPDCNCAAVPSWDKNAPEVDVDAYTASERTAGMTPENREEHNALIRRAIAQYT